MAKDKKYYGVVKGRTVGVFRKLSLFENATKGYPGALWKEFETQEEAAQYVKQFQSTNATSTVTPAATDASTAISEATSGASPAKRTKKKLASTQTVAVKGQREPEDKTMAEPTEAMQDEPIKNAVSRQKSVQLKPCSEPPFGAFIDRLEAPQLPPLADPELFDGVFFQSFASTESKYLPHYGDLLLKSMTFDVLTELFGKQNFNVIRNITPFAISNAFYEQIYLHYGLEKLSPYFRDGDPDRISREQTHRRGDILEAYMAAIEKDISRNGQGYQEVRDWLLKVMALRLQLVALNDNSSGFYSAGTVHQSFTIIPPLSPQGTIGGNPYDGVMTGEPTVIFLSSPAANAQRIPTSTPVEIWSKASQRTRSQFSADGNSSIIIPWSSGVERSSTMSQLHRFRQFVFEKMAQIFCQCHATSWSSTSKINFFWRTFKGELDNLREILGEESQMMLLHYYRSYVHLQLEDTQSAIEDLRSVLSFQSSLFNSKIHECAVKRLLSIQSTISMTVIACDIQCRSGLIYFGDEVVIEWNPLNAVRRTQERHTYETGQDIDTDNHYDPMDID